MNVRAALAVLVLGLAACGGTESDEEAAAAATADAALTTSGHTISGKVSPSHTNPLGGTTSATLRLTGPVTRATATASDGSYAFRGLPDGNYVVTPKTLSWLTYVNGKLTAEHLIFGPPNRKVAVSGADAGGQDFASCYKISTGVLMLCGP